MARVCASTHRSVDIDAACACGLANECAAVTDNAPLTRLEAPNRRGSTDDAYQRVPRAGRMPRSLSALVIASSVVAPVLRTASMTGRRPEANWSAGTIWICRPHTPAAAMFEGLPGLAPLAFLAAKAAFVRS